MEVTGWGRESRGFTGTESVWDHENAGEGWVCNNVNVLNAAERILKSG